MKEPPFILHISSKIFTTLLQRQVNIFVATSQTDGNALFKDERNALIHPGEYGMYREQCFRELLQSFLTRNCKISDSFIISACDDHITTQCDVLMQNAFSMPLTDSGIGKFHPAEDIYAVVEMKSNLTKATLKDALRKLAKVKMISDDRRNKVENQETRVLNHNLIPTFLVCNKFTFDKIEDLDLSEIYEGIDRKYWHNAILSVEDRLVLYRFGLTDLPPKTKKCYENTTYYADNEVINYQYSQHIFQFQTETETYDYGLKFLRADHQNKYDHIIRFLSLMRQTVNEMVRYQFDSLEYIN